MKKIWVLFGLSIIYAALLTPLMATSMWLIAHVPETFDLGYYGLIFLWLLASMVISGGMVLVYNFIYYETDLLD